MVEPAGTMAHVCVSLDIKAVFVIKVSGQGFLCAGHLPGIVNYYMLFEAERLHPT